MKFYPCARTKMSDSKSSTPGWASSLSLALGIGCMGLAATLSQADAPAGAWWLQDAPSAPAKDEAKAAPAKDEAKAAPPKQKEEAKPAPKQEEVKPAPKKQEETKPVAKKQEEPKPAPAKEPAAAKPAPSAGKAASAAEPMKETVPAGEEAKKQAPSTPAPTAAEAPKDKAPTAATGPKEPVAPAPMLPAPAGPGRPSAVTPAAAPTPAVVPVPDDVKPVNILDDKFVLNITDLVLVYDTKASELLPIEQARRSMEVTLARTEKGLAAPAAAPAGSKQVTFTLADVGKLEDKRFTASAIQIISQRIVSYFNEQGIIGVAVGPHPHDVNAQGQDLRKDTQALRMVVRIGVVKEIRSLASGDRIPLEERVNNSAHQRVKRNSPVQDGDAIDKPALDSYLGYINRHPNRRVDVALSRGVQEGTVALDYLVAENKPWLAYFQLSNTGTSSTNEWRERFGFSHSQLTNNDDVFDLQYTTAAFDASHFLQASYEAPFFDVPGLRWKAFAHYSQYTASDVGAANLVFEGESWSAGGQLIYNLVQHGDFFIDAFGGARWDDVKVEQPLGTANEAFFIPTVGFTTGYRSPTVNVDGMVSLEWNADDIADTDPTQVGNLGRAAANADFVTLQWYTGLSFYLEPLFNHEAWSKADVSNDQATLAHELSLSFEGQYGIDGRLPANYQRTAGGLYTVRGYAESTASGDSVLIGRLEYRFHIPRIFPANSMGAVNDPFGNTYQLSRSAAYGRADWDLIFRGFLDVGQTYINDNLGPEAENTLVGTGVGLELLIKQNMTFRMDWGVALNDVQDNLGVTSVSSGSNRFHFIFTFLY